MLFMSFHDAIQCPVPTASWHDNLKSELQGLVPTGNAYVLLNFARLSILLLKPVHLRESQRPQLAVETSPFEFAVGTGFGNSPLRLVIDIVVEICLLFI